ncbi:DUF2577 domain-containing protein [Clostridium chromiireducens]|uniref:DUF2577 domain-containing protein n=1 Tax=Clostridium chromiireducens TaxID=225345 RepID=UPI003AF83F6E
MSSWENELAREFKKRDNQSPLGAVVGTVITVDPIKISILGDRVFLTADMVYMCSSLINNINRSATIQINGGTATDGKITYKEVLKAQDQVVCLPADGGQKFFIIDKVV